MKNLNKVLSVLLVAILALGLAACQKPAPPAETTPEPQTKTEPPAEQKTEKPPVEQKTEEPSKPHILLRAASGISTLSPQMANAAENDTMIFTQGTLYMAKPKDDGSGVLYVPALAAADPESVNADGTLWNIKLDPAAKWDNGDPINADTYMYSWRQELDPKLVAQQAALFGANNIKIKNAVEYFKGEITDFAEVGIKKIDDYTLQIETTQKYSPLEVRRHFCGYWTSPVHPELFESCKSADGTSCSYGTNLESTRFSGPFIITNWVKGSRRILARNENFLHKDWIKLDGVTYAVVTGAATRIQMFEKGELDYISLDSSSAVQYADDPRLVMTDSRYVRSIHFADNNTENPIVGNLNFKNAIYYAVDRIELAKLAQARPANHEVPYTTVGAEDGTRFRNLPQVLAYSNTDTYDYDPELAVKYFEKALEEMNLTKVEVSLTHTSGGIDQILGEYLQEQLAKVFGADRFHLALNGVPNKNRIAIHAETETNPNAYELLLRYMSLGTMDFDPTQGFLHITANYHPKMGWNLNAELQALYDKSRLPENRDLDTLTEIAIQMEKINSENRITVPLTEDTSKLLIAERVILPLIEPDVAQGFCLVFADVETK